MFYFKGTRKPDFTRIQKIDYDRYWFERGFAMRSKLLEREKIFFDWIQAGTKVADIGCGNSRLLLELKSKKNCQVFGVDTSTLVIAGLNQHGIEGQAANIEEPNFQIPNGFDYVVLSEVLEHLRFPEEIMKKFRPRTNFFAISIPNSAFYRYRIGLMFKGRFFTQWAQHPSEHLRFWSHVDFLDWLRALGFEAINFKASNGFWFKDAWPNMFGHQMCYLAGIKQ